MTYLLIYFLLLRFLSFPLKCKKKITEIVKHYSILYFLTFWLLLFNSRDSLALFVPVMFMISRALLGPFDIPQHCFLSFFHAKHLGYRENSHHWLWIVKLWHTCPFRVGPFRVEILRSKVLEQRLEKCNNGCY